MVRKQALVNAKFNKTYGKQCGEEREIDRF